MIEKQNRSGACVQKEWESQSRLKEMVRRSNNCSITEKRKQIRGEAVVNAHEMCEKWDFTATYLL